MLQKSGFTLIELLITVTIIAVLSAVAITSYSGFVRSSRDAKRQADLKFIQSALENYNADQKYYPTQDQVKTDNSLSFGNKVYLTKIPNDPTSNPDYSYIATPPGCSGTSCTSYCLYAKIEGKPLPSDSACNPPASYNYGITRP